MEAPANNPRNGAKGASMPDNPIGTAFEKTLTENYPGLTIRSDVRKWYDLHETFLAGYVAGYVFGRKEMAREFEEAKDVEKG
jgi:hypothetical protein